MGDSRADLIIEEATRKAFPERAHGGGPLQPKKKPGRKRLDQATVDKLRKLAKKGWTKVAIAKELGISRITVSDYTVPGAYNTRREKAREHMRRTVLGTGNRLVTGLSKRPYPGYCELCGREQEKRLYYHHWDDADLNLGIWMCHWCHQIAEAIDRGTDIVKLADTYVVRKQSLESWRTEKE